MQRFSLFVFALLGSSPILQAQITMQQPVLRSTSIGTAVSVPDGGSTFLGGVNSGESFRQSYGPLRTGTSRGYGLSGGSMSASVRIIDLQAMDEAILNSVPDSTRPMAIRSRSVATDRAASDLNNGSPVEKAANFERLARQAETAGKHGVAKLHWQMAARHGSALAQEKLDPAKTVARK